ncbi:MAG: type II toxin-antitoxin system HicA family toxin [Dehalococcoidia bacterium]
MARFSQVPACSSNQITAALERLGCYPGRAGSSSHRSYHRDQASGRTLSAPVVLGKREVPRGTLRNILQLLDISLDDFLEALR